MMLQLGLSRAALELQVRILLWVGAAYSTSPR